MENIIGSGNRSESGSGIEMKALYVVVNAGYSDKIMEILRNAGSKGGTIIHARGEGFQRQSFMGITLDYEREMIISVVDSETADKVMAGVKEKAGWKTDVRGICFTMPVDRIIGLSQTPNQLA